MQQTCRRLIPRLRAASRLRSSSAEPIPRLCHRFSMLKATSASRAIEPQIGGAAQHSVHEEAVNDHIAAARRCGIGSNYAVGDCATETVMTTFSIEPEQMAAIGVCLDVPELPDHAAFDKNLVHRGSPLCLLLRCGFPRRAHPPRPDAVHPVFSCCNVASNHEYAYCNAASNINAHDVPLKRCTRSRKCAARFSPGCERIDI